MAINLGDTLSIIGEFRAYTTDKSDYVSGGTKRLNIPYANYNNRPATNTIVNFGLITDNYPLYTSWMLDFALLNALGSFYTSSGILQSPDLNYKNYFPDTYAVEVPSSSYNSRVLILNSGKVLEMSGRITGGAVYDSLNDYLNDNPAVSETDMALFGYSTLSGSTSSRGLINAVFYDSLDENTGKLSTLYQIRITGVQSTTNTISISRFQGSSSGAVNVLNAIWDDIIPVPQPTAADPYTPGGESETGGGTGDFDITSDPIDFPALPSLSSADAGFITLFNPSAAQLKSLANYMWSNSLFDLDTWKKIFADPMDAILGLVIVPVAVPNGGSGVVTVGNISTNIIMTRAASQYVEIDCGTLNVNEYWGAYLDYSPFTKAEIYLPYIGTHALNVDDIMNKAVHVKYHVDILSGACAAYVKCGDSVLYTFIGQCASSIPITGSDMTNVINGVISAAAAVGTMIATEGATAPMAVPALANTAVNSMKPEVEKSGSMSGTGGMLGVQTPYLILTRPRQCLPATQNSYMGYPSFISSVIGDLSGYTEVERVHLDGVPATDVEISEIESLLKSGVIL